MLHQIKDILNRLTKKQRVILALSTIFSVVGILLMAIVATKTKMSLLYSGLDEIAVAELSLKLDNMDVIHSHKNGAIFIDKSKRDKVRMQLAREGLPRKNIKGYELLDDISGFGTTSEMFQAKFLRAKEGEIARTIVSMEEVEEARVHIAPSQKTSFNKKDNETSASVMIRMRGGAKPDQENARAIKYLVALAVGRLSPDKVSVIDATTGMLIGANENDPNLYMIQKKMEIEDKMGQDISHLLGAHVGYDNVKVQVSVGLSNKARVTKQRNIDPDSRTVISTATSELTENSKDGASGEVTAQNNIPDGNGNGNGSSSSNRSETEEKVNYEISQTETEEHITPGNIERVSVAVLINHKQEISKEGVISFIPHTKEELIALEDIVKSASGFNAKRGDKVTIKSLVLIKPPLATSPPHKIWTILEDNLALIIEAIALLLAIAGVALGVVKPIITMGGDNKHQEEITKMRTMYEEQIQALIPTEEEIEVNVLQNMVSEVEEAIKENPEEALNIVRQWLHQTDGIPAKQENTPEAEKAA